MHFANRHHQRGFNLLELVTVLSITAIALCTALPWFGGVLAGQQQRTAIGELTSALASARMVAVERRRSIVACPSHGEECEATSFWHDGWIVFEDTNRNAQRDTGEPVLHVNAAQSAVRIATNPGRQQIRYRFDGSSDGSNATITFCDRRGASKARTLVINNAGRVRSTDATDDQAASACEA